MLFNVLQTNTPIVDTLPGGGEKGRKSRGNFRSTFLLMIRVSVLYPSGEGSTFDHNYYRTVHVPMAVKGWNPVSAQIDKGVSGPYEAAVHFVFPTITAFENAMGMPVTADLMADLPNYTNISAVIQVAEIVEE
jgi:uncharacterized protein (TIGR02118 family)